MTDFRKPPPPPEEPSHLKQSRTLRAVEKDWRRWLLLVCSPYISAPFGTHHRQFWTWVWSITKDKRPRPWVSVWPRGGAKALAVDTPLPSPDGWTTMGNIRTGDRLFDETGAPCTVTSVSEVSTQPCYRVHFSAGAHIDASGDHLWTLLDRRARRVIGRIYESIPESWPFWHHEDRPQTPCEVCGAHVRRRGPDGQRWCGTCHGRWKRTGDPSTELKKRRNPVVAARTEGRKAFSSVTHTTEELLTRVGGVEHEWAIPVARPFQLSESELPLDPWLLGCWLGDGRSNTGVIHVGRDDVDEVQAMIEAQGWTVVRRPDSGGHFILRPVGLTKHLREMMLLNNKHVPSSYLRASEKQRLGLLSGLCDTDGTTKRNSVSFTNTNFNLAQAVHELAISLGYKASINEKRATLYGKDCGPVWRVAFAAQPGEVFRLSRKRFARTQAPMLLARQLHFLRRIERLPDQPVRCIVVDSPSHLFLAGRNAIPTHNSVSAELAIIALGARKVRRYALYISDSQDLADRHLESIGERLESEEMALFYPDLADRAIGKFGPRGWRRNRLHTRSGFVVDALGLDAASRGIRVDVERPGLAVIDDIDDSLDTPETTARKIESLTRRILPACTPDAAILAIQNLISHDGVFAQLVDGRATFLADRIISGPIPAVENLTYESRLVENIPRTIITGGTPTWVGLNLERCQQEIDKDGITVFMSELQHELMDQSGGMFDHVTYVHCTPDEVPPLDKSACWVDPAVTEKKESDSCGVQIDGISRKGILYRLYSWEERSGPLPALTHALRMSLHYGASYIGVETDQGGDTWRSVYNEARRHLGPDYDHIGFRWRKAGAGYGNKVHRASQMLADYERGGRIVHVEGTHHILERALNRFPRTPPLDLVDAATWAHHDLRMLSRPAQLVSAAGSRIPTSASRAATVSTPTDYNPRRGLHSVPMPRK